MKIKLHSQYDHFPNCQTDGDEPEDIAYFEGVE